MKLVLFGAKGFIGVAITNEALRRGHEVTAVVRDPSGYNPPAGVKVVVGDASNSADVAKIVAGYDAVISAIGPTRGDNPQPLNILQATHGLLDGLRAANVKRLLMVGGAGSLEVAPGVQLVDTPEFPDAFKAEASAARDVLNIFKGSAPDLDWTFFSPSFIIEPGERTGEFRVGGDQPLFDANGQSRITSQDFAIAIIDELEQSQNIRRRITVGY